MENVFGLMTTGLGRMASRAFKPDTPEIPEADFGKEKGSNPRMAGTMAIQSCTNDEARLMTAGNARTKGVNPSMAGRACLFLEFDNPGSAGISMISSMTTKEEGAIAT